MGAIASCLVFVVDDALVAVIKSSAFCVDTNALCTFAGGTSARQATPGEIRRATGQTIGGVSPTGWPTALRVYLDQTLATYDRWWTACGTPNCVFATNYDEFCTLTGVLPIALSPSV